jgi:hypothetical protein
MDISQVEKPVVLTRGANKILHLHLTQHPTQEPKATTQKNNMSALQPVQMQQPQVIVVQAQQFQEPPGCCYNFWCPPCAVAGHEGCGGACCAAFCLGPCFTLMCWTPKKIPV